MSNLADWLAVLRRNGSNVTFHREAEGTVCPCVSPEGYRQPEYHNSVAPDVAEGADGVPFGFYTYKVLFAKGITPFGSDAVSDEILAANKQVSLTNIPIGPSDIEHRYVYRRLRPPGETIYRLIEIINNNTATAINDNDPNPANGQPLTAQVCNEAGEIPVVTEFATKGFVQPAQSAAVRRLTTEYVSALFGEVRSDDHLGIFPLSWSGQALDFEDWSQAGEDFVIYDGHRYLVVNANKIPDPDGGEPHHWEVGLRRIKLGRMGVAA